MKESTNLQINCFAEKQRGKHMGTSFLGKPSQQNIDYYILYVWTTYSVCS